MTAKSKKVAYKDPTDENADYLEPLQCEPETVVSDRKKSSEKSPRKPPVGFFGSAYLLISLLLFAGVPLSQFVIGFIYIGQCTIRPFIFIYMILSGAFGIAFVVVGLIIYMQTNKKAPMPYSGSRSNQMILKVLIPIFIILFLFVIGWFIAGQVIVFEVKTTVELFDPVLPEYCHGNLYKPAYILIFVDYLIILFVTIINILRCMLSSDEGEEKKPKPKPKRPIHPTRK
ncbi:unnamed protein product [Rotaria magnacalcarata]|uniref:Uncharacterized protein n=1 Tax=Rotaria magnacalcarata TaxID=392030 RepID=A0A815TYS9_9BILA|nr:unnamed protein product [Rotaria magnacalcarata]CAF5190019.1 unnamed protein product [Rotaria magnacalcarata]